MSKSRPIPLNAPMVIASLDGSKTQTRRAFNDAVLSKLSHAQGDDFLIRLDALPLCPYGQIGDQLWVRESARIIE